VSSGSVEFIETHSHTKDSLLWLTDSP